MAENRFAERPVLAICISIAIVFVGLLAMNGLAVEKFPDIAPPTVYVSAYYSGASAETVQKAVVIPLEESINGVENMIYMESSATSGAAAIIVYFKQGTNADMAAVNVQNRVSEASGLLPSEVTQVGVTARKRQNSTLALIGVYSPDDRYDDNFIANYLNINVVPQIQRIEGVGNVNVMGSSYSMRIWLNPETMAHYGLIPSDITSVLATQNIEASTGSFGENSDNVFTYTMKYRGRYETPEEFGELVVSATKDGEVLRLKDVAEIELGKQSYSYVGGLGHHPGVSMMISQISGSNATQINLDIEDLMEEVSKDFPDGLEYIYLMNTNDFLFAAIEEVIKTLIQAMILVILVVFFFLHSFRLTLIPTLSLIVSLVGTFAAIYLIGFSINMLTLFALILVIGTVVDDAIVVVEAVEAKMEGGEKDSLKATHEAMHEVTAAIVTSTIVFMAVFIPVSFMGGTSGIFYKQFGLTMAAAVGISLLNALTLCPALTATMLRHGHKEGKFTTWVAKVYRISYDALESKYRRGLKGVIRHRWTAPIAIVVACVLAVFLINHTKTGLVPAEDVGTLFVSVDTSPGNSTASTNKIFDDICEIIDTYPEIKAYSRVVGFSLTGGSGASSGVIIIQLKNWNERKGKEHSYTAIMARFNEDMKKVKDAQALIMAPSMIDGYGTGNAVALNLQDKRGGDIREFCDISQNFLRTLNQRPEVMMAFSSYQVDYVQYQVDVDAAKCLRAGISPSDVLSVISGYYGGIYASNIIRFSKVYRVYIQADPDYRLDEESFDRIYCRNGSEMAPVSQFATLTKVSGPESMSRFNLYNSISASVTIADGYSSGDVINAIAEVSDEVLPDGYSYEFSSSSREESSGNNTVAILIICVILIYLLLASLYESFFIPFAVILALPFGVLGCFLGAKIFGVENNIYLQTGMIMVMGLLAKTAILITEYAQQRREAGMSIQEAAFDAARVRLRPILMTVLTLIFGMLPLLYATGASANGDLSLGSGVVVGMIVGTIALLFVVPALFVVMQKLQERYGFSFKKKD